VHEWHKRFKEGRESLQDDERAKKCSLHFLYDNGIIRHESVSEKQTVNGIIYKQAVMTMIARVLRVRPEFQESGSLDLLHDSEPTQSSAAVSRVFGETRDPRVIISTLLP
jgi:hypothetical protein